jgi:hypothetical protein
VDAIMVHRYYFLCKLVSLQFDIWVDRAMRQTRTIAHEPFY